MSPHHALLSLVMLPSSQSVSSVGQGLCWLCMHRPHEDVVGLEWCMGMPPLVHFLNTISVLVYVSPPRTYLPCRASFLAARSGFGWARVVLAVHAPAHEDVVGSEWCMGMHLPCSLPILYFSSRVCIPTTRFSPLSCFLPRSKEWVRLGKGCAGCACTGRMRTLWVWSGAWECPPVCTS